MEFLIDFRSFFKSGLNTAFHTPPDRSYRTARNYRGGRGRVGQGISPSASHGTVLESLNSYGSYCPYRPISQSVPMHK